jgi:hypothetical protein
MSKKTSFDYPWMLSEVRVLLTKGRLLLSNATIDGWRSFRIKARALGDLGGVTKVDGVGENGRTELEPLTTLFFPLACPASPQYEQRRIRDRVFSMETNNCLPVQF